MPDLAERIAYAFPRGVLTEEELREAGQRPPNHYVYCPIRNCWYHPECPALIGSDGSDRPR